MTLAESQSSVDINQRKTSVTSYVSLNGTTGYDNNSIIESGFNSLLREQKNIPKLATGETTGSSQNLEDFDHQLNITADNLVTEIFKTAQSNLNSSKLTVGTDNLQMSNRLEPLTEAVNDSNLASPNDRQSYSDASLCYHDEVPLEDEDDEVEYRDEDISNQNGAEQDNLTFNPISDSNTNEFRNTTTTNFNDNSENMALSLITTDSVMDEGMTESRTPTPTESIVRVESIEESKKSFHEIRQDFERKDISRSLQAYQNQSALPSIKILSEEIISDQGGEANQQPASKTESGNNNNNKQTSNNLPQNGNMSSNQNTCERSEASSGGCHKDADPAGSAKVKLTYVMGNCHMYNLIVYPDRAHVYRKETPRFNANEVTEVLFDCVSPAIQKDSIRVELRGRATILDVALKEYSIDGVTSDGEYVSTKDQLIDEIRKCNKTMEMISARISRSETQRALLETYADKMSGKTNEDEADEPSALPPLKLDKHKDKKESKAEQQQQIIHHGSNDKKILNPYDPTTMDTLSRFLVTYEEQIEKLDLLILDGHDDLDKLAQRIEMLEKELIEIDMKQDGNMHKELSVLVEPRETGQVEMIISYVVGKCGWVPSYDIRMFNSDGSMKIIYYGMIVQSTGENWEKIPKMSLSTAEPGLGGTVPQLGLQKVQYKSGLTSQSSGKMALVTSGKSPTANNEVCFDQMSIASGGRNLTSATFSAGSTSYLATLKSNGPATIHHCHPISQQKRLHQMRKGHSTTGKSHCFDDDLVCRDGNHLSGSLQRATSVLENNRHSKVLDTKHAFAQSILMKSGPTGACIHPNLHKSINSVPNNETVSSSRPHVNFEVPRPLAIIKSDGTEHRATVGLIDLSPNYDYVSVPKRSPYAFLKAEAVNQSSFYLLAGQTNIYSDNTFIGKIDFKDVAPGEKFSCQLGSEHGIKLAYKPMFKSKETSGSKSVVTFKQCIDVKNTFDRAIKLTVIDQLPVSGEEKIKIHLVEPSIKHPEKYDPKKPIRMNKNSNIEWDIDLKPGEQKELVFKFTVEHPANEELEVVCSEPNV